MDYEVIRARSYRPESVTRDKYREDILRQYRKYCEIAPHLETLTSIGCSDVERRHLRTCYKHTYMATVKQRIREGYSREDPDLDARCQLCSGMGLAKVWDHYLPQHDFADFSACAHNLVWCCSDCNDIRKNRWIGEDGKRTILHLHYEPVDVAVSYLHAEIFFDGARPEVRFEPRMPSSGGDEETYAAYCRHFETLELRERFGRYYRLELVRMSNRILDMGDLPREGIIERLRRAADNEPGGVNTPAAALYRAAADSEAFLEYTRAGVSR